MPSPDQTQEEQKEFLSHGSGISNAFNCSLKRMPLFHRRACQERGKDGMSDRALLPSLASLCVALHCRPLSFRLRWLNSGLVWKKDLRGT